MRYTEPDHNIGDIVLTIDATLARNHNWEPQSGYICEKEKTWNHVGQYYEFRYKVKFFKTEAVTCSQSAFDIALMKQRVRNRRG